MTTTPTPEQDWLDRIIRGIFYLGEGFGRGDEPFPGRELAEAKVAIEAKLAEREVAHQKVYEWLFGLGDEFPESLPGARYNWRTELRQRIPKEMLAKIEVAQKAKEV